MISRRRVTTAIFLCTLTTSPDAFAQSQPACTARELIARERLDPAKTHHVFSDGTAWKNPFAATTAATPIGIKPRTEAELNVLLADVRALFIDEISQGRPFDELNPGQQLVIKRLGLLTISTVECTGRQAQGTNHTLESRLEICSSLLSAPIASLVVLLGHELSHSIDISKLGCRLLRLTNPSLRPERQVRSHSTDASVRAEVTTALTTISTAKRPFNECGLSAGSRDVINALVRSGEVTVVDEGLPPDRNPSGPVLKCLAERYNSPTSRRVPPPRTQGEAEEGGYREFGEPSAQVWGAHALSLYVKAHPQLMPTDLTAITQLTPIYPDIKVKGISPKERDLNEIYFSDPATQAALRCRPEPNQDCMKRFNISLLGNTPASLSRQSSPTRSAR